MKAELPTEEDVLAHLVLYAVRPVVLNCYSSEQWKERTAWNAAIADLDLPGNAASTVARRRLDAIGDLEAAIADSERRFDCERARDAVLAAASAAQRVPHYVPARDELWQAVRTWRTALFRINPTVLDAAEVSHHGG